MVGIKESYTFILPGYRPIGKVIFYQYSNRKTAFEPSSDMLGGNALVNDIDNRIQAKNRWGVAKMPDWKKQIFSLSLFW